MKNKITQTQKTTILLLVTLIVLSAALYFWCQFIFNKTEELVLHKHSYVEELVNTISVAEMESRKKKANEYQNFLTNLYINADEAVDFISFIEALAVDANTEINIQSLNSSKENNSNNKNNYETIDMTLVVRGEWENVNNFIMMLENLPHHISISELRLSSAADAEGGITWSANIRFIGIAK